MPWCVRWARETVNNGSPRSLAATEAAAPDFRSAILSRAAREGGWVPRPVHRPAGQVGAPAPPRPPDRQPLMGWEPDGAVETVGGGGAVVES